MAESKVSMKLLIDTQAKRILFAEASKDCVDFLFHILSLPVATVISLLTKQGMVGSLANLYESIEKLNDTYIQPNKNKDTLLKPSLYGSSVPHLLLNDAAIGEKKFYKCNQNCSTVADDPTVICPRCKRLMNTVMQYVADHDPTVEKVSDQEGGFVRGVVTYMIMDDLVVTPMSTISSITLLNKFNVKEVGKLEEKVVNMGMDEAVKLLKSSLHSKTVLTDVFMKSRV